MRKTTPLFQMFAISFFSFLILLQLPFSSNFLINTPVFHKSEQSFNGEIVFLSDTQDPIWIETLLLEENDNVIARELIFNEIIKSKPGIVIHLGDIVAFGYKDASWKPIDNFLNRLLINGIGFYPTLGNHELLLFSDVGEKNFNNRFPFYSKTVYSIKNCDTEIILLNSNFSEMTHSEIEEQQLWYINTLNSLEADSTITTIIVGTHHPPFTNSTIVSPNKQVKDCFVESFINNSKCKVFISGHSHAFEHIKYKGKDFFVIGGGGGLQHPMLLGKDSEFKDIYILHKHQQECSTI